MTDSLVLKVAMAQRQSEAGYGRARMDCDSRIALGLEIGDTVEIVGKRSVVAKVFKSSPEESGKRLICIDGLTRTNAGVGVGDSVTVRKCNPSVASEVVLAPNIPEGKTMRFEPGIEDVFLSGLMGRPIIAGTDIIVPNIALMGNRTTFTVSSTVPSGPVIVGGSTRITVRETSSTEKKEAVRVSRRITYDDIGGLNEELGRVREVIELPLKHPELFDRLGISPPRGVMLYGPPGTGKTLIAEAVANETGAKFYCIRGPEIMGQFHGQSEERLRNIFAEAERNSPSIIFLDEIDSIAPRRDSVSNEVERRVVAQLLTLMDGMDGPGNVIVIGATNREDSIDPALRRPGRFDREVEIGIPSRKGRREILDVHMRDMPLTADVDPDRLASLTQGFVGADLEALCREAAMRCLGSKIRDMDMNAPVPKKVLEGMRVSMDDFLHALGDVEPSGMREVSVEIPKVTWDDIGGLDDVRRRIDEFLDAEDGPLAELGIRPGRGILLYGPPGTGKTLVAKAVANQAGTNFISVSGPEMASKWLGESERAVRRIFKRAKQMAPCIIFFDEIDSIAPVRGDADGSAWERVVAQLLTSMDGVEGMRGVTVMAATNRPDMIDPALLRPGRFDSLVLVGKPDRYSRRKILGIHTRKMPLYDVDLDQLSEMTDGYVGADLEALCREAGLCAYREGARKVSARHFESALESIGPSVDGDVFEMYEKMGKRMGRRRPSWDDTPLYR